MNAEWTESFVPHLIFTINREIKIISWQMFCPLEISLKGTTLKIFIIMKAFSFLLIYLFKENYGNSCQQDGLQQGTTCQTFVECYDGMVISEMSCPRLSLKC